MLEPIAVLVAVAAAFFVSASAGLGGSLVLIPALSLALGVKEGVALASLLLAANNLVKVGLYRHTLPVRGSLLLAGCTILGVFAGARLLVGAAEHVVAVAVIVSFVVAIAVELASGEGNRLLTLRPQVPRRLRRTGLAPALALGSGATSGFSGMSGPLKGVAVRNLGLDRIHTVGAASMVSLVGDLTKTAVFADAGLLGPDAFRLMVLIVPLMVVASMAGRWWNTVGGEHAYTALFWLVMAGYTTRLLVG